MIVVIVIDEIDALAFFLPMLVRFVHELRKLGLL